MSLQYERRVVRQRALIRCSQGFKPGPCFGLKADRQRFKFLGLIHVIVRSGVW